MGKRSVVVIRPEKPQDYAGVHEINRLAFRRENEARLIEELRSGAGYIPELSIVAMGGKNIVGHIFFSPIHVETPSGIFPALVMAPVAVRISEKEDVREKLLKEGIKECRRQGYGCIMTVGDPADYAAFGFMPAPSLELDLSSRLSRKSLIALELTPGSLQIIEGKIKFPPAYAELWDAAE